MQAVHGVRYQVKDVARSVAFYTTHLGFTLEHQQLPAFASVSLGDAQMLLSGPQASGSRPMPNGQRQEPGGWNRVVLRIDDLAAFIDVLKKAGLHFRNTMETGPGGRQIQIEDPDGIRLSCSSRLGRGPLRGASARSSGGSVRTSRSSACARSVMELF
ncbi:MAG TPA: VOC family protein [Acidobacteriota bacterium]